MRIWIFLILFSISYCSVAQENEEQRVMDSLKTVLSKANPNDTSYLRAKFECGDWGLYFRTGYWDSLVSDCERILKLNLNDKEIKSAKGYLANSYNNLAYIYDTQGQIEPAIAYNSKSLKLHKELGNLLAATMSLNNLATIHFDQGSLELSKSYFEECLVIQEKAGDKRGIARSKSNLAQVLKNMGKKDEALSLTFESLAIREEIKDFIGIGVSYNNLGLHFASEAQVDTAIQYFEKSIEAYQMANNKMGMVTPMGNLANQYYKMGELHKAIPILEECILISEEYGSISGKKGTYMVLSNVYRDLKDFKKALGYYKIYISLRDSMNNEKTQKASLKEQAKYEYEKQKAIDDAEHDKQLAIEQEAKEKQRILTFATAGGLGLVGIFLLFVFNRLKVTRKQKGIIEMAHTQLEEKNQEILDSINYAKRIQSAILPPDKVVKEYLKESFIFYLPKDIVAGDFYWLEQANSKVLFAAADCTGHGVPGAMVSVVCNNGLNRAVREHGLTDPGKILDKTREIVVQEFEKSEDEVKDGMDIALCSLEENILHYAGAHNPLWIIRSGAEEIEEIKADKQPIGKSEQPVPYTTHKVELNKGDTIYVFSDGYADQFGGEKGKKLKTVNFKKLLLSIRNEDMQKQKELIHEAFLDWRGELDQLDDICVIGVRL